VGVGGENSSQNLPRKLLKRDEVAAWQPYANLPACLPDPCRDLSPRLKPVSKKYIQTDGNRLGKNITCLNSIFLTD
jgi:hypothetical protein